MLIACVYAIVNVVVNKPFSKNLINSSLAFLTLILDALFGLFVSIMLVQQVQMIFQNTSSIPFLLNTYSN